MAGSTYAVLIAIENYQQSAIRKVDHAAADAKAMRETLITRLGVPKENVSLWIDQDATQNRLHNDLVYDVGQLGPGDRFIFFYAGHGFYAEGSNRVTTWDTHPTNLAGTTTSLEDVLLSPLRKGRCRRSLVFIDACAAALTDTVGFSRDILAGMDKKEFAAFVESREYAAAFFSCSPTERSHSSATLQHGIWTYHLLNALRGDAKEAIQKDRWITGDSLQNYLAVIVPQYIREKTTIKDRQRPYAVIGSNGAFEIVKIPEPAVVVSALPKLKLRFADAYFRGRESRPYRDLQGFDRKRGHTVPTALSDGANAWAGRLLHDEMVRELEAVQENAKSVLRLKRRDIRMDVDGGNGGSVDTDWFRFSIFAGQNTDDAADALLERQIALRVPADDLPESFDEIFPGSVDEVIIPLSVPRQGYEKLADAIEDLAVANGAQFKETRSARLLMIRLPDGGPEITFDAKREQVIVCAPGCSECLPLIELVRTDAAHRNCPRSNWLTKGVNWRESVHVRPLAIVSAHLSLGSVHIGIRCR